MYLYGSSSRNRPVCGNVGNAERDRAAYGKGYCDALTEELPGSLCADHGYRVPERAADPTTADA